MAENNINVEEIMEGIRKNIRESGADKIPLTFAEKPVQPTHDSSGDINSRLNEAVSYLSYNYEVQPYQLLTGNPIKCFVKKVIRKVVSFFFLPIVAQQNTLNYYYYQVAESVKVQRDEIAELKKELEEVKAELNSLKK